MIRRFTATALAFVLIATSAQAQTVVIVRHGEKADQSRDPDLSAQGQARAQALAQALSGAQVAAIFATPLKRTQQTAAPTARAAGVAVVPIPLDGGDAAHAERVATQVRQAPADATVLVVGHSNTFAAIARALGDPAPQPITDCDYDRLTVLQLGAGGAKVVHTRYGAPTHSC